MANVRFFRRGVTEVYFCQQMTVTSLVLTPDLSNNDLRTTGTALNGRPEALRLTGQIADMTGFTFSNTAILTPDLTDNFDSQIPGIDAAAASSIKFYERRDDAASAVGGGTGNDTLRAMLAKGNSGWVVILWGGFGQDSGGVRLTAPAAGDKCEVWPVISTGPARDYVMGAEAAKWHADFSITSRPSVDTAVQA